MFSHRIYMLLKSNSVAEFTQRLEKDMPSPCFGNRKDSRTKSRSSHQVVQKQFAISI